MLADCRRCVYFVPFENLSDSQKERGYIYIAKHRSGQRLLGWCTKYDRPVTYYIGKCYSFRPRKENTITRSLLEFLGD